LRAALTSRTTLPRGQITGLVLAGGRGSRMGGIDKGLQLLDGQSLARHVLDRLVPQGSATLISANRHVDEYRRFGVPVVLDATDDLVPAVADEAGLAGPLAGILAGMRHATTPYLLIAPCDVPFVPLDLGAMLGAALMESSAQIAIAATRPDNDPFVTPRAHPVTALVTCGLADDLAAFIQQGGRQVSAWYARHTLTEVLFADDRAFYNINTLQQLHDSPLR
jgi:molybdopterin-guanine dinucleotide biosynthesis protein A